MRTEDPIESARRHIVSGCDHLRGQARIVQALFRKGLRPHEEELVAQPLGSADRHVQRVSEQGADQFDNGDRQTGCVGNQD